MLSRLPFDAYVISCFSVSQLPVCLPHGRALLLLHGVGLQPVTLSNMLDYRLVKLNNW